MGTCSVRKEMESDQIMAFAFAKSKTAFTGMVECSVSRVSTTEMLIVICFFNSLLNLQPEAHQARAAHARKSPRPQRPPWWTTAPSTSLAAELLPAHHRRAQDQAQDQPAGPLRGTWLGSASCLAYSSPFGSSVDLPI